jgi:hypothetical protein
LTVLALAAAAAALASLATPFFATACPPRPAALRGVDLEYVRALAIRSDSYQQNYFRPGCGMGREAQTAAWLKLEAIARADPGPLIALLNHPNREVRGPCALVLGWVEAPAAVAPLRSLLTDRDAGIRCCAAAALGKIGDRSAAPDLLAALDDPDREVRWVVAWSLGELGDRRALAPLRAVLARTRGAGYHESNLAWSARRAIEQIGDGHRGPK